MTVTDILHHAESYGIRIVAGALDGTPEALISFAQSLIGARPPVPDETGYFTRDEA